MERIASKLTRVLVITLLSAATLATASLLTVKASSIVTPQAATPIPPKPMCEAWESAKARNSPAAANLEPQCHAQWAARGIAIQSQYPWAAELRSQLPNDSARRGFDIGMAAAEGQTAPGPGKQRLHDALSVAEQEGYSIAVNYSLMWNKNLEKTRLADLAARGAVLVSQDQGALVLLNQQPEGPARRGFYIGMGIWEGNTVPGPGKQKIHDLLSAEEQGGFDVAASYSMVHNRMEKTSTAPAAGGSGMSSEGSSASTGVDMAGEDSSAADFRHPQPERPIRRGSDSRNLWATLEHLKQGKKFLEAAKPDEDGHREKAIDYTNKAIEELVKALAGTE